MKLRALHIHAYGALSDVAFDFNGPPALDLIYGRNEAGKSTTLRAISAFFYGFSKTRDAYVHRFSQLRVGASIETNEGDVIALERRTEQSKSVIARSNGTKLDDSALSRILGGVDKSSFEKMYGLNHETLRKGAEALLAASEAGESIFGAALGGGTFRATLERLEKRSKELFATSANNKTAEIPKLKIDFEDAQRALQTASALDSVYTESIRGLHEKKQELSETRAQIAEVNKKRDRIDTSLLVLSPLGKRQQVVDRISALGEVILLPENAREVREHAERTLAEVVRERERAAARIQTNQQRLSELTLSDAILKSRSELADFEALFRAHREDIAEIPKLRAELSLLRDAEARLLRTLGATAWADFAKGSLDSERVVSLLDQPSTDESRHAEKLAAIDAEQETIRSLDAELASLGAEDDDTTLRTALDRVRSLASLENEIRALRAQKENAKESLATAIATLGLANASPDSFAQCAPPSIEQIDDFRERWQNASTDVKRAEEAVSRAEQELLGVERDLRQLESEGVLPSESDLLRARTSRDALWQQMQRAKTIETENAARFDREIKASDSIADALRTSAARVSQHAALREKRDRSLQSLDKARASLADAAETFRSLEIEWVSAWQSAGIAAGAPSSMQKWAQRFVDARTMFERFNRFSAEEAEAMEREASERSSLSLSLALSLGAAPRNLGELSDTISRRLTDATKRNQQRAIARTRKHDATRTLLSLEREAAALLSSMEKASRAWGAATAKFNRGDITREDARTLLSACHEIHLKQIECAKVESALSERQERTASFETRALHLANELAPELASLSAEAIANRLLDLSRKADSEANVREHTLATIETLRDEIAEFDERIERERTALGDCMRHAGANSTAELIAAEERSIEMRELIARKKELEDELAEHPNAIALWEESLKGTDRSSLVREKDELDSQKVELEDKALSLAANCESIESGIQRVEQSDDARKAAAVVEDKLARLRAATEEYVVTQLSIEVLRAEIERYADAHQGPILIKTSALFARFTLGAYESVRVANDELVCVRADGKTEVDVKGLSDGTRDQLYLALRIASFERHRETGPLLPLVLDDILVHSDDERARAILSTLADLTQTMQVLFFTHHARIVELAKEVLPGARLRVHDLARPEATKTEVQTRLLS